MSKLEVQRKQATNPTGLAVPWPPTKLGGCLGGPGATREIGNLGLGWVGGQALPSAQFGVGWWVPDGQRPRSDAVEHGDTQPLGTRSRERRGTNTEGERKWKSERKTERHRDPRANTHTE